MMESNIQNEFRRALEAVKEKNFDVAAPSFLKIIAAAPNFVPAYVQLGQILAHVKGRHGEAEKLLIKATELDPKELHAWLALFKFYARRKDAEKARATLEKAVIVAPGNIPVQVDLLKAHYRLKDYPAAIELAGKILLVDPANLHAKLILANCQDDSGNEGEALEQYAKLIDGRAVPNRALERWVQLMMKFERTEEVIPWLEKRVSDNPGNVFLKLLLAGSYVHLGVFEKAVNNLEAARKLDPENIRVLHDLGVTMRFTGRIEESKQWFERVLAKDPNHSGALRVFGSEHRYEYGDHAFNRLMRAGAHQAEYTDAGRVQLHYALGKCFDDVGDYATAFEHFGVGGKLHLSKHPQSDSQSEKYMRFVRANLTKDFFASFGKPGAETSKPLFVLGMPRSGTSLVEQVLASHPEVFGAGELKLITRVIEGMRIADKVKLELRHRAPLFHLNAKAGYAERGEMYLKMVEALADHDCQRIVDKMPGNYMWAGLIHMILPNAPIVHTRRHPIETCLSAYRIFFPDGQYWSFDLKEMGKTYRSYLELMQHWRENLPEGRILEVRYEDMVNNFEEQARRLIAYCGLEWNDTCLNFHETDRAVRTASASQVRKPVYKTSIGRWRKYEPYLKPLLDELGPLVQQYEDELSGSES